VFFVKTANSFARVVFSLDINVAVLVLKQTFGVMVQAGMLKVVRSVT
jgi:hypothetical protein